jgi:hypothetical protein
MKLQSINLTVIPKAVASIKFNFEELSYQLHFDLGTELTDVIYGLRMLADKMEEKEIEV